MKQLPRVLEDQCCHGVTLLGCFVVTNLLVTTWALKSHEVGTANLSVISASSCPYQSADTVISVVMPCPYRSAFSSASLPHLTLHSLHHTEVAIALIASRDPTSRRHSEGVRLGIEASQVLHVLDELG